MKLNFGCSVPASRTMTLGPPPASVPVTRIPVPPLLPPGGVTLTRVIGDALFWSVLLLVKAAERECGPITSG